MYQALYRKWRPQTFDEVIGQKHITETLKNQILSGRLSHAYIFIGTRGTGKTTCARILAKAVNCEHPVDGNPCGVCAACRGIADGSVLDIVELDAASNNGVDNVRALREEAVFSPASVRKRVYIIDEVHMLSTPAFNALLKILEEPPEHLMFVLATTELQKVPATILSRCQRHQFHRIDTPQIAEYLRDIAEKEGLALTQDASELIARMADGGVRDALSLLDQCSASESIDVDTVYSAVGLAGNRRIAQMLDSILNHDTPTALTDFGKMWMDGKDPSTFLTELSNLLRDIMMVSVAPKGGMSLISGGYDTSTLKAFAARMTSEEIICAMDTVRRSADSMRDARNPRTAAELCLVSLCESTLGEDISSLRARISRLETQLSSGVPAPVYNPVPQTDTDEPEDDREYYDVLPFNEAVPEDDIDPSEFAEEQPEDAFLDRGASQPPAQEEQPEDAFLDREASQPPAEKDKPQPVAADSVADAPELWQKICDKASPSLPFDVRFNLGDSEKVRGEVSGGVLRILAEPNFMYKRLSRSDFTKIFSDAASELLGRSVNTVVSELVEEGHSLRDLNELIQFPETKLK